MGVLGRGVTRPGLGLQRSFWQPCREQTLGVRDLGATGSRETCQETTAEGQGEKVRTRGLALEEQEHGFENCQCIMRVKLRGQTVEWRCLRGTRRKGESQVCHVSF